MRRLVRYALPLVVLLAPAAHAGTKLLRFPDICAERIVFSYGGDLWTVSSQGGTALRLTAGPGLERSPRFSPDCKHVAFTGQYDGDDQVYVMPSAGGEPRQLTYYPATGPLPQRWGFDNQVYGWTPDGARVLFRSMMDGFALAQPRLFTVAREGGLPEALPMPVSGSGDFSPDGKHLAYSPLFRDFRTWNRYQGGWAQDLYIVDLAAEQAQNITQHVRTDRDPMWIGDAVYFVSDRDDVLNLYRYDVGSGATTQLTQHRDFDVRWASSDGVGQIVYEFGGALRVYDARSAQDRGISVTVPTDGVPMRAENLAVADKVEQFGLSPDGKRAWFVARGDVFTVPSEQGVTRNLSNTSGVHEREVQWSPDAKTLVYVSDAGGEEAIWVRAADGSGAARQLTRTNLGRLYAPRFSPDGKRIAFSDSSGRIHVVTVADGALREVANDPIELNRDYQWSVGSGYLAYTLTDDNNAASIFLWDAASGKSARVTDPLFNEFNPAFSPDGKFLYFLGNREWTAQLSQIEFNFAANRTTGIYALTLAKDAGSPFALRNDEPEAKAAAQDDSDSKNKDQDKNDKQDTPQDHIDLDGLAQRLTRAPIDADNIGGLAVTSDALLYAVSDAPYYGRDGRFKAQVHRYTLKDRKDSTYAEDVDNATLSADGSKLLVFTGGAYKLGDLSAEFKDAKTLDLSGMAMARVPREEFAEIFREVWRRFRDYFYVENMHGYDWNALRAKYEPMLADVSDRSDLNYLLGQMVAELNVGHAYVAGGDIRLPAKPNYALLGARFALDGASGRYRIASIMPGANDEARYRSPLTEVGIGVKPGDYVLAINGRELRAPENPFALLRLPAKQPVELRVSARADGEGARTVLVEPISDETELKYLNWVSGRRAYVTQATQGRIGYLHIPDMGGDGLREFIKWYYPQLDKQALVIDVRDNGGGNVSQMIIERLGRRSLTTGYARGWDRGLWGGSQDYNGHLAALTSESTASDGDIFSYTFRQAGLGPLIGKRTWGGVVGISDFGPVVDGGSVFVPQYATASVEGQYVVEGEGVAPDIEVENDLASMLAGRDAQLDRAIAELEAKIKTEPRTVPTLPVDPVKAPEDMRAK
jgi:tricorn protease